MDDFGKWLSSLASDALTGFPTQVAAALLCSRCLASRNLQNAHPFAEVWRMGGGGGVEGGGDVCSSATYRRGGLETPPCAATHVWIYLMIRKFGYIKCK